MPFLLLGDKYARAVKVGAQAQPVLFPLAEAAQIGELLALVDGVLLTGSPSNVHPAHFDEDVHDPALPLDPARDALTLALVRACLAQAVPLLGICRGFQEI
ncbi:MAG: gamma-glutamyl-gamma-aminobutyrate hydrolase family protein, partial [Serpentinimonas sp.]|nr:gamma-glutamyl-gamma-aminobutyrate hydrolase family protein [Serpentinimonas sp.]